MRKTSFAKPAHRDVATLLERLDAQLFARAECYFAGGTAIVMLLEEYRESRDVDFLCANSDGYRTLRLAAFESGLAGLFVKPPKALRDLRADQYGIRAIVEIGRSPIKFEIVREARIALEGNIEQTLGVPVLAQRDLFAEKLLANADRGLDRAALSRDFIDLVAMQARWGAIPRDATAKAEAAYGKRTIAGALRNARRALADHAYREKCITELGIERWLREAVEASVGAMRPRRSTG